MKKFIKNNKILIILLLICLMGALISALFLQTTVTHKNLGNYTRAICKKCSHVFKDEFCEKCGSSIVEYGVFRNKNEGYNYDIDYKVKRVDFKDYFTSFKEYKRDYQFAFYWSGFFIGSLISIPLVIISYIIYNRKRKVVK